jgi:hypothetical protein
MIKRPVRVACLAIIILFAVVWNGLRIGETIFFWKTLEKYGAHPLYITISGTLWLLIGLVVFMGVWLGKAWGWAAVLGGTVGYSTWYWFDRLVMQKPHANWAFVLIANLALLLIILMILMSHETKRFFKRDVYERKPQTPTIT